MRPVVVTALLLLVCILHSEMGRCFRDAATYEYMCNIYRDNPCGDGWSRIDEKHCAKFFESPKTFQDAEDHCRTLNGELVSIPGPNEIILMLCLTWRADSDHPNVWTGTTRSEARLRYTGWFESYDGQNDCVELNTEGLGYYEAAPCSKKNHFVCIRTT